MAAKHRRTKGKDWKENSNDDTSNEDNNTISKLRSMSHEKQAKRNRLEESSDESTDIYDMSQRINRSKSSRQSKKKFFCSSSDSDLCNSNKEQCNVSKLNTHYSKACRQIIENSSESDSESKQSHYRYKRKITSEKRKFNLSRKNSKTKINQCHSDTNSNKEFQKPKLKKIRKLMSKCIEDPYMDNYSHIGTPCRSDDENIPVEKKQEIKLKHYIIEEVDKIQTLAEELKNNLKVQGEYLIEKKVNVVRDSKFIAHKILRIYDSIYDKLRANRNNFVCIYKSWIDTCSNNNLSNISIVNDKSAHSIGSEDNRNKRKRDSDYYKWANVPTKCSRKDEINSSDETEINENLQNRDYEIGETNFYGFKKKTSNTSMKKNEFELSSNIELSNDLNRKNNSKSNLKKNNLILNSNSMLNLKKSDTDSSTSTIKISHDQPKKNFKQLHSNDSPTQVSDCDSDEIFSETEDKNYEKKEIKKRKKYIKQGDEEQNKELRDKIVNEGKQNEIGHKGNKKMEDEEGEEKKEMKSKENKKLSKEVLKEAQENADSYKMRDLSKDSIRSSNSDNGDLFESSSSDIDNTPIKPSFSKCKAKVKKIMSSSGSSNNNSNSNANESTGSPSSKKEKKISPSKEMNTDDSEAKARNNLLNSSFEESLSDTSVHECVKNPYGAVLRKNSEDDEEPSLRKSNNLLKKNTKLLMQTKKQNSISSDSSSDSAGGRNGQKILRQANGDDLPPRYRRRQAFSVQKNRHYKADKKLRMECRVTLERLSQNVLVNYSRALEKSKKYVANKKFHSITNLDGLEMKKKSKKHPASDESLSSDNSPINSKTKKKSKNEKEPSIENFDDDNEIDDSETNKILSDISHEEEIVKDAESKAKEALLETCSDSSNEYDNDTTIETEKNDNKKLKNSTVKNAKNENILAEVLNKNIDEEKEESSWKKDELLNFHLTDSESEEEKLNESEVINEAEITEEKNDKSIEETPNEKNTLTTPVKKKRKQRKVRVLDSDSDAKIDSSDEDSDDSELECDEENEVEEKKKKSRKREKSSDSDTSSNEKKQKSKRKRIKKVVTDSESDDQDSPGKGRKNIRKVLKDKHVADDTKKAAQDEEERLKRIAERQRLFNEMYDARLAGEAKVDKLVLDFDEETKKELVVVDKELVKRLKPHQAKGIKFMWDACFESLKQIEKSEGSGCIIAHCMGLGKTFQVVTLSHTLLSHEETKVRTVMVVCPLSTVLNWVNEFKMWLKHVKNGDEIEIYELTKMKKNIERKYQLESWQKTGGVLIIGYEMFRNLTSTGKKMRKAMQESIMRSLVDPGADLVVCDEGHLLKNEDSALSKAMKLVKTLRRIVLTGTPLQNNLKEYHCMVQFVKPNLLGSKKEFLNRFVNPITNGQFDDSTPYDVKLMKKRAHVLHKMLEGSVQRFDYSVLTPFLPPKQEYVIFVRLTEVQIKMYQHYLDNFARRFGQRNGSLFADFQELQRIWTHPYVLRLNAEKVEKANEKKRFEASDSEGSLKDFIDDESESDSSPISSSGSGSNSDIQSIHSDNEKPVKVTRSTRLNMKAELENVVPIQESVEESAWWSKFVEKEHFEDLRISTKLVLLFGILKESEQIGDKVLVFSQSLYSLTLIEYFLNLIDQETQNNVESEHLDKHSGSWALGLDYFRLDGSTSAENRSAWCKIFNNPNNTRARLFLISTRAGGLGINLTAANRVIIFDASWNPSHDVQSIFRIYRFGQKKPCYVYRFLAAGTMEEKIYNRQVTKLSLACRVVDEQQIERHYSNNDLAELYQFESYEGKSATLNLPKDRLLAEIFLKYKDAVYNYHEHDSLLENKQEEELDEEERKQAWLEYEEEKQGKRQIINMGNNFGFSQMMMNMNSFPELENIKLLIQKDYPNLPPEHLETVARQAIYDMYRFVDQQAVNQTLNPFGMQPTNMFGAMPQVNQQQQYNPQSQLMNMLSQPQMNYPGVNHMPVYSGRGRPPKHMSMNNPMANMRPMQAPPMHLQQPQIPAMSNNDEVEILSNQQVTPSNIDPVSNNKNIQNE